ncbi:MAG TPA: hypothetical protein VF028_00255 [Actinomycetota bacterium]|nr:hypothetical protein [Actinomycetota bacterium]
MPTAPLHVPSGDITVAAIPALPAMSFRIAWNSAAARSETGSSLMSANASIGKASTASLGEAEATLASEGSTGAGVSDLLGAVGEHPASATMRAKIRP